MKKPLLLAAALLTTLCFAGLARAEAPVTPAATTAAASSRPLPPPLIRPSPTR